MDADVFENWGGINSGCDARKIRTVSHASHVFVKECAFVRVEERQGRIICAGIYRHVAHDEAKYVYRVAQHARDTF